MTRTLPRVPRPMLLLALTPALAAVPAARAADGDSLLVPDRPGFTNGAETVAPGHVQIEIGVTRTKGQPIIQGQAPDTAQATDAPQTLIRTGLNNKTELRITLPNYLWPSGGDAGFTDAAIGLRYRVFENQNTKVALSPTLSVPLKTAVASSGHVDPALTLNAQAASGARWGIQSNLSLSYPTQDGRRVTDYTGTAAASYALSGPLSAFVDYSYDAPVGSAPSPIADGGLTYKISKTAQLDLETGRGLGGGAPTQFYGGGLVIVF